MASTNGYRPRGNSDATSTASSRSGHSSAIDEAYRRVGHRLSQTVGGDENSVPAMTATLGGNAQSAFASYPELDEEALRKQAELGCDRSNKVAKTGYADHGSHGKLVAGSILKNLTYHARETFSILKQQTQQHTPPQAGKKRVSPASSISPYRNQLSALALEEKATPGTNKGLLQAVLDADRDSHHSGSSSTTAPTCHHPTKGRCLTQPSDPTSNEGLDNADGNLIVHENDYISVPSTQVHTLLQGFHQFRVLSLLGQGTFAQVFKCQCLQTKQIVALKVVKNKPAYTRQAAVEIDVFTALSSVEKEHMIQLQCYFMYRNHLCLVFELLGLNLYEVLKRRQFRGLPLHVVRTLVLQALSGLKELSQKNIVHCDLKPENILLLNEDEVDTFVNAAEGGARRSLSEHSPDGVNSCGGTPCTNDTGRTSSEDSSRMDESQKIKLIDFGSACFEGHFAHTYIQSRFYRSPEVLVGLPYDSAIDMWSMGCVAAELFLGLPILPGVHEHDQLGRISEMIGPLPDRMLEQGSKANRYFVKQLSRADAKSPPDVPARTPSPAIGIWRLKTQVEYIQSLSPSEIRKKGGLAKLQKQPANRYFKRRKLFDIVLHHGQSLPHEENEALGLFAHFLMDPLKRWTAFQASTHPFITGGKSHRRRSQGGAPEKARRELDIYWAPPWDPAICRRKLLDVQRTRDKQRALRRSLSGGAQPRTLSGISGRSLDESPRTSNAFRRGQPAAPAIKRSPYPLLETTSLSRQGIPETLSQSQGDGISPPSSLGTSSSYQAYAGLPQQLLSGSFGSTSGPPQPYTISSCSDYSSGVAFDHRQSMSSIMMSSSVNGVAGPYSDVSIGLPMYDPQSFTSVRGQSLNQLPVEADFGYALQRPGVFPGMDLSGASSISCSLSGAPFSPHQMPAHQRSRSFTHTVAVGGNPMNRRRASGYAPSDFPGTRGQSQFYADNFMTSPTSIQEDSTNFVLGQSADSSTDPAKSVEGPSVTSSLLAQQLEGRASCYSFEAGSFKQPTQAPTETLGNGAMPSRHIGVGFATHPHANAASANSGCYYYTTYVTSNGVPMSALMNMDMRHAAPVAAQMHEYGPYGTVPEQQLPMMYGPPSSLHQAGYAYNGTSQPTQDGTSQGGSIQWHQYPPPELRSQFYHHGMSM